MHESLLFRRPIQSRNPTAGQLHGLVIINCRQEAFWAAKAGEGEIVTGIGDV